MINLHNITKHFGKAAALHGVNLAIEPGEFIALIAQAAKALGVEVHDSRVLVNRLETVTCLEPVLIGDQFHMLPVMPPADFSRRKIRAIRPLAPV